MARALIAVRLSNMTDETTSPERQRAACAGWAALYGHTIAGSTEDVDVSGSIAPALRASLGPWLTDPALIAQWDVIVVAKLDRLTRSLRDFDDFRVWCDQHGKAIASVAENLDLSTPMGRLFANLLAMFAQFERERAGERRADAAKALREAGKWGQGRAPYGLTTERAGSSMELRTEPVQAKIINDVVDNLTDERHPSSWRAEAARLTAEGILAPNAGKVRNGKPVRTAWDDRTLAQIVTNPVLRGYIMHAVETAKDPATGKPIMENQPVMGTDGLPVTHGAIVIAPEKWEKLERVLARNSRERSTNADAPLLRGILAHWHGDCTEPRLSIQRYKSGRKAGQAYYRHDTGNPCPVSGAFNAPVVESAVTSALMAFVGDAERCEWKIVGEDHSAAIAQATQAIAQWQERAAAMTDDAAIVAPILARLTERVRMLQSLPKPRRVAVSTGQTFREAWSSMSVPERNAWLRELGVKVAVRRVQGDGTGAFTEHDVFPGYSADTVAYSGKYLVHVSFGQLDGLVHAARSVQLGA